MSIIGEEAKTLKDSHFYPLSVNPTNWSNTLKQFVGYSADELFECV